jgi:hypothetical protein
MLTWTNYSKGYQAYCGLLRHDPSDLACQLKGFPRPPPRGIRRRAHLRETLFSVLEVFSFSSRIGRRGRWLRGVVVADQFYVRRHNQPCVRSTSSQSCSKAGRVLSQKPGAGERYMSLGMMGSSSSWHKTLASPVDLPSKLQTCHERRRKLDTLHHLPSQCVSTRSCVAVKVLDTLRWALTWGGHGTRSSSMTSEHLASYSAQASCSTP